MIKTVVFDLDDTLYDEIDYCKSGFRAVAQAVRQKFPSIPATRVYNFLWKQFTSGNRTKTFNAALGELGVSYDDKIINDLKTIYRNHVPDIKLPSDTKNVLDQLYRKYTLALLTDGFLPAQQLKVKALDIERYFKCIIYTEQLGRQFWKPSPVGFEKILQDLNTKPATSVFVADNAEKDFIAPNQLGFATIQITRPARLHAKPPPKPNAAPQHVIENITQLPPLLEKL
jgi:putative hydrolase of the HAD superfamily